jgi:hypothetical protein
MIPDTKPKSPPLPFDTSGYIATTSYEIFPTRLPPHPSMRDRLNVAWNRLWKGLGHSEHDAASWAMGPTPVRTEVIQGLLNQCMQTSGVRYLMPRAITAGTVQFGNSNMLNGRQWIASVEAALETNNPDWWDYQAKKWDRENLVLIRYPEQKTVLVLPTSMALEFRRTNNTGIIDQTNR